MKTTAGDVAEIISTIRSKVRVYEAFVQHIRTNYLPSDAGASELQLERKDGARVTPKHFEAVLTECEDKLEELNAELAQWEGLPVGTRASAEDEESEEDDGEPEEELGEEEEEAPKPAPKGKKHAARVTRLHSNTPASK